MSRFTRRLASGIGVGVVALGLSARAMFFMDLTENVPIERVIANLERRAAVNPADIETRLNLGRIHAMAYARKSETWPVVKPSGRGARAGEPAFGPLPGLQHIQLVPAKDGVELELARAHLPKAIAAYDDVLAIDPKHTVARIGRAWCQDQAGDKVSALAGYRALFEEAWKRESAGALPSVQNFMPTTIEVGGYLLPLLDPMKDAAEIATIRSRTADIQQAMRTRPITPIVIPLRDAAPLAALLDPGARVSFDADGSGIMKRWTWITPDAGWLVFDKLGRRQVTSALQWFGGVTFWLFWQNGYYALRALDDNDDGALTGGELTGLAIWRDVNANGVSDRGEVRSLDEWGIVRLSCVHDVTDHPDLAAFSPAGVTFADGRTRPTYDVLLYPR